MLISTLVPSAVEVTVVVKREENVPHTTLRCRNAWIFLGGRMSHTENRKLPKSDGISILRCR